MRRSVQGACVAIGVVFAGACAEDVDSSNVRTDGMFADFSVTGRASGQSEVRASIRVGGANSNTYAELSDGDVLTATSGDETRTMTEVGGTLGNVHIYSAVFDGADEGQAFTVSFEREEDESAPNSTSALPSPFTITSPVANEEISRTAPIVVAWDPADSDSTTIRIDGDCIVGQTHTQDPDLGTYTIAADSLNTTAGREGDTCNVELRVSNHAAGSIDPAFGEGGRFDAMQERTVTFRSTP